MRRLFGERPRRIADYGLVGDGRTAALVGRDGSIDWLCLPRFDAEACFAALLGGPENGFWRIAPERGRSGVVRRYLDDTLVLETVFETRAGAAAVLDFMAVEAGEWPVLVRIVEGRRGALAMESILALRFDYGRIHPRVDPGGPGRAFATAGPNGVSLAFDVPLAERDRSLESRFTVKAGERLHFVLAWGPSHQPPSAPPDAEAALATTVDYWRGWIAGSRYDGPLRPHVRRSLLTLKALIHRPTGAILAAPTASLPERAGGERNWDYRYCWLRDATFTLMALIHAGLEEEARAWVGWLHRAMAGEPANLQPLYTLDAARRAPEWEADWLAGFAGSRPVRFGNAAVEQFQLDLYGEVLDTLCVARRHGVGQDGDDLFVLLADRLAAIWEQPDAGIWESRGEPRQHTYSKVMCWVGFDRAASWFGTCDPKRAARFARLARKAKAQVLRRGYDRRRRAFVRAFDDRALDAATLRLPLVGFLPADDPRVKGTVRAVERRLMRDGLVMRYETSDTDDGVGGEEGAFVAASFWLVDVYVLQGRIEEARRLFHRACDAANDLDLLSEELSPEGELLGNFPQGLSHLALVSAGLNLTERGGPAHERAESPPPAGGAHKASILSGFRPPLRSPPWRRRPRR